ACNLRDDRLRSARRSTFTTCCGEADSSATSAVITLVRLAGGSRRAASFSNRTRPDFISTRYKADALTDGGVGPLWESASWGPTPHSVAIRARLNKSGHPRPSALMVAPYCPNNFFIMSPAF